MENVLYIGVIEGTEREIYIFIFICIGTMEKNMEVLYYIGVI